MYILTEFLPGGDLFTLLQLRGYFPNNVARFYMAQIILAVEAIHRLGVVCRNLKPENVLLDLHGNVKIADFGFGKLLRPGERFSLHPILQLLILY